MQRKLLATVSISLCLLLSACSGRASGNMQQEIELSLDNVNDYIDFVSIGKSDNDNNTDNWILINKQYENGMIYIKDNFDFYFEQTFIAGEEFTASGKSEKVSSLSGNLGGFEAVLTSLDKPIIKDISGTITLYKDAEVYFDDKEKMRIVKYGSHMSGSGGTRAEYFNDYPY